MQIYSREFAEVYETELTSFVKKTAPLIEQFYSQTPTSTINKSILDLCCGTGHLANVFLRKGYHVVGIDASESMLFYANNNNREFLSSCKAEFVLGDVLEYSVSQRFGLITCTYDSINHLENERELWDCFKIAHGNLVLGGYFIFDINTRASLLNWNALSVSEDINRTIVSRGIFDGKSPKAVIRFSGFKLKHDGLYEKFEQIIYNAVFDTQVIERLLMEIGFSKVYFALKEDISKPIDQPENIKKENELFVIACK